MTVSVRKRAMSRSDIVALENPDRIFIASHFCIGVYLETYVESGRLEEEWVVLFDHVRGLRQADQYSLDARPTQEEAEAAIHGADRFINRMEDLIREVRQAR